MRVASATSSVTCSDRPTPSQRLRRARRTIRRGANTPKRDVLVAPNGVAHVYVLACQIDALDVAAELRSGEARGATEAAPDVEERAHRPLRPAAPTAHPSCIGIGRLFLRTQSELGEESECGVSAADVEVIGRLEVTEGGGSGCPAQPS